MTSEKQLESNREKAHGVYQGVKNKFLPDKPSFCLNTILTFAL